MTNPYEDILMQTAIASKYLSRALSMAVKNIYQ